MADILNVLSILRRLRGPGGCDWDQRQTHVSLAPKIEEEASEVVDAIKQSNDAALCEELGDVLINIALHCVIAEERGAFTFDDVVRMAKEKLIRRHPHVFGDAPRPKDDAELHAQWKRIKAEEGKS